MSKQVVLFMMEGQICWIMAYTVTLCDVLHSVMRSPTGSHVKMGCTV